MRALALIFNALSRFWNLSMLLTMKSMSRSSWWHLKQKPVFWTWEGFNWSVWQNDDTHPCFQLVKSFTCALELKGRLSMLSQQSTQWVLRCGISCPLFGICSALWSPRRLKIKVYKNWTSSSCLYFERSTFHFRYVPAAAPRLYHHEIADRSVAKEENHENTSWKLNKWLISTYVLL